MSDLKFSCPSCGQHIQCEDTHAGEKIPCPGCATVICVPADAQIIARAPVPVHVVSAPPAAAAPSAGFVPTLEENFLADPGTPPTAAAPLTEREQQLAAARAAHPMNPNPQVKPRLSFILSGGAAPAQKENESAMHSVEQKPEAVK